ALADLSDQVANLGHVALLLQHFRERAGNGRRQLQRRLVRLDLDQRLIALDRIAFLLEPGPDLHFGDRFAHFGNAELDGHRYGACPNAAERSRSCSILWLLSAPLAGVAASGRETPSRGKRPKRCSPNRARMYRQAPMFSGSSWTQQTGVPSV